MAISDDGHRVVSPNIVLGRVMPSNGGYSGAGIIGNRIGTHAKLERREKGFEELRGWAIRGILLLLGLPLLS